MIYCMLCLQLLYKLSGEIDFLETAWTVDASTTDNYRRLFNAQWNQVSVPRAIWHHQIKSRIYLNWHYSQLLSMLYRLEEVFQVLKGQHVMLILAGSPMQNVPIITSLDQIHLTLNHSHLFMLQQLIVQAHSFIEYQVCNGSSFSFSFFRLFQISN